MNGWELVSLALIFGVATVVLSIAWLMAGAKERPSNAMSVPATRILAGEERYPRLPALSALPDDDAGLRDAVSEANWQAGIRGGFSHPAAKGFKRDATLGRDAVTQEERNRWIRRLDEQRWGKSN